MTPSVTRAMESDQRRTCPPTCKVSVIVVSWNAREYLMQCLASLKDETCRCPMEIIVVDNASSDASPDSVAAQYPDVHLIRNAANLGFAKANNLGLAQSQGAYLCFVNSDVEVLPGCISRLVEYCEQHPEVGMVGPRILGGDGKLQRSCRGFPSVWNMFCRALALDHLFPKCRLLTGYSLWHWAQTSLQPVDILTGCFWLVRRKALEQVGLLDEAFFMYGEDMDWCKRFWAKGWQVVFVPGAEAIHYGGVSSDKAPVRFYVERQRADFQYWRKHHSRFEQSLYFLICCVQHTLRILGHGVALLTRQGNLERERLKVLRSYRCLQWLLSRRNISSLAKVGTDNAE